MATIDTGLFTFLGFQAQGDLGGYTMYTDRRRQLIFFPKHPPLKPASPRQALQRQRWKIAAQNWQSLSAETKAKWKSACNKPKLSLHGYNLWMYYQTTGDLETIRTIERTSNINLV